MSSWEGGREREERSARARQREREHCARETHAPRDDVCARRRVARSAHFSAAVTELADVSFVGTALALQLGIGFALTVLAVWALPLFADLLGGWQWAFLMVVPGTVVGVLAMLALKARPEAARLAGGRG